MENVVSVKITADSSSLLKAFDEARNQRLLKDRIAAGCNDPGPAQE